MNKDYFGHGFRGFSPQLLGCMGRTSWQWEYVEEEYTNLHPGTQGSRDEESIENQV
jgi:hypothetical protein